jgi:hypothetical protein
LAGFPTGSRWYDETITIARQAKRRAGSGSV